MGCECMKCNFRTVIEDNEGNLLSICVHRESDNFLKQISIAFDGCELGELEEMYLEDEYTFDGEEF